MNRESEREDKIDRPDERGNRKEGKIKRDKQKIFDFGSETDRYHQ